VVDRFHEEMEIHIQELADLSLVDAKGQPYLLHRLSDERFIPPGSGFYWEVERAGYTTIRSPSLDGNNLPVGLAKGPEPLWQFILGPTGSTLEYAMTKPMTDGGPPLLLYIATDQRMIDEVLAEIDWPLIYSLGAFAIVMILIGAIQINYSMRPLHKMQAAISAIRNGRERRMMGNYPSEIMPLVSDLNQLLTSNWDMLQSARVQAGNLAHGLRTPLAIIADEAQLLADKGGRESACRAASRCSAISTITPAVPAWPRKPTFPAIALRWTRFLNRSSMRCADYIGIADLN
jgi:signal transduction histidine kinase